MSQPIQLEINGSCSDGEAIVVDGDLPNLRCQEAAPVPSPKIIKQTTYVEKPYRVTVTKNPDWWWYGMAVLAGFGMFYIFKRYGSRRKRVDIHHHKD